MTTTRRSFIGTFIAAAAGLTLADVSVARPTLSVGQPAAATLATVWLHTSLGVIQFTDVPLQRGGMFELIYGCDAQQIVRSIEAQWPGGLRCASRLDLLVIAGDCVKIRAQFLEVANQ